MSRDWLKQLQRWAPYALTPLVVVAAAKIGATRLIDNLEI